MSPEGFGYISISRPNWQRRTWSPLRGSLLYQFSKAWGIYRPMGSGSEVGSRMDSAPRLIGMMSLQPAIPGGLLSSRGRFRFTGQAQNALQWSCRSSILQRRVNGVLFGYLSRWVHPTDFPGINVDPRRHRFMLFYQFPDALGPRHALNGIAAAAKASHGERAVIE